MSKEKLEELLKFELSELEEKKEKLWKEYDLITQAVQLKKIENMSYEGKFIKYYEFDADPTYMHVRSNWVTRHPSNGNICIIYQGHGFSSEFGPYADCNYMSWSTWKDLYVPIDKLIEHKDDVIKEGEHPIYKVVEITKDEYIAAFNEMVGNMSKEFPEWIVSDERKFEEKQKEEDDSEENK